MSRKLASVVRGDGFQILAVCEQHPYDSGSQWLGPLAGRESLHHHKTGQAFKEHQDRVSITIDNKIHLKVPESSAVGLGRLVVYACAVGNVGCLCRFAFTLLPTPEVGVATQFAAFISVYNVVDGL